LPAVLLSVVATLAVIAPVAIFFRPDIDPQVSGTQYLRAGEQLATSGTEAIDDRSAAERFLAQTRGTKVINNSLAAEDQFIALSARLSTLQDAMMRMQDAMTRILRDNADIAQQLRATQTQLAQDNALVAEQLKALTQMTARRPGVLAMGSDERRPATTTGSTATAPAITRSRTVHRKDQARFRVDGTSGAKGRSRASPAPTAAPERLLRFQ
jgi:hypothetical protein